jgi:hypothetical protein
LSAPKASENLPNGFALRESALREKKGYSDMAQSTLRLVEGNGMDKSKALDAALSQIERSFGKGSIMKLGKGDALEIESVSTGSHWP